jgi:hypothetical protein
VHRETKNVSVEHMLAVERVEIRIERRLKQIEPLFVSTRGFDFRASEKETGARMNSKAHLLHIVHEKRVRKPQFIGSQNSFQPSDRRVMRQQRPFRRERIISPKVGKKGLNLMSADQKATRGF